MNNRRSVSLMVFLCMTSGWTVACDEFDEFDQFDEFDESSDSVELAAFALVPPAVPAADQLPPKNVEPTEELVIGWNRWALSQPWTDGPISDTTGEHCADSQEGPVWYLAGTNGGSAVRECDIPAGKQLFLPLVNTWTFFPPQLFPTQESIDAGVSSMEAFVEQMHADTCSLTLRIDGQDVIADFDTMNEELHISVMDPFEINLNDDHCAVGWFQGGGLMPAVAAGHYALLQPLTPGDHVVEFGGSLCEFQFSTGVTFLLHVGA